MTFATHVEFELNRARIMVSKDKKQRWVTMDGRIHESPVPFRDAISVYWMPIVGAVAYTYKHALPRHPAL